MPELRADLHAVFAQSCLDGAHVRHVRELDVFINHSALADRDLSLQLTHALQIALAREKREVGFAFENGTERSIAIFRHLLSLVRRAPKVFATLASPEGGWFDLRAIDRRLLDERLDHAEQAKAEPPASAFSVSGPTAGIARQLGLDEPYTLEAVHARVENSRRAGIPTARPSTSASRRRGRWPRSTRRWTRSPASWSPHRPEFSDRNFRPEHFRRGRVAVAEGRIMTLLLIILIVLLLAGGGGLYGRRAGWGAGRFGGLLVMILLIVLLVWAVNELLMPTLPMPQGVPSITR